MSEIKYIKEKQYLQKLYSEYADKKPHLADVLDPQDPQTSYLLEGFAFLSARLQDKIDDAFPEITLPLLQRLDSQAIKGLPATTIVQIDQSELLSFPVEINKDHLVLGNNGARFSFCHEFVVAPYSLLARKVIQHPNRSCISLELQYRGETKFHSTSSLDVFLGANKKISETLLLAFSQYFEKIEVIHNHIRYEGDPLNYAFEPKIGKPYKIFPQENASLSAPQQLLEGLYLPHVHHFVELNIPQVVTELDWEKERRFTVNIYFNQQLPLTQEECENSFYLNCAPAMDTEAQHTLLIDFKENKSSYLLPIPSHHYLADLFEIQLSLEPHEQERGIYCHFYPTTELTASSRLMPQYHKTLFYSLTMEKNITGHTLYYLNFFDNKGAPMVTPPSLHFSCVYIGFERNQKNEIGLLNQHSEKMPDGIKTGNITLLSPCYPPIVNNHHFWQLLSHYSANASMLMSLESVKHLIADYILYRDTDRQVTRRCERLLSGLIELKTHLYDHILKGKPYRCLSLSLRLDNAQYESEGEAFVFTTHLYHFFPFCLSANMLLEMSVTLNNEKKTRWHLSPSPLKGHKSMI
ncbi:type VI secretion system baseplate subunit TssF [Providencia rettgeri]|uniref:type VI secretion system baseplate subunit TssF n=1 Tax=Providencia rettgeri TaxID=587 RepID=UPI0018C4BD1C|nr:type VI secretion system baseplate subunit TssF [Providencia rettgeri]MBG5928252.1 type VI secretion system baseplate subunit TssF [Providencia rettgeri]